MELTASQYSAEKTEERSSLFFIICSEPLFKCQLVHWYFGSVPREPIEFRIKGTHDRVNTNDITYKCNYLLDVYNNTYWDTRGWKLHSAVFWEKILWFVSRCDITHKDMLWFIKVCHVMCHWCSKDLYGYVLYFRRCSVHMPLFTKRVKGKISFFNTLLFYLFLIFFERKFFFLYHDKPLNSLIFKGFPQQSLTKTEKNTKQYNIIETKFFIKCSKKLNDHIMPLICSLAENVAF